MYHQTWTEFICPACKKKNFVCDGDINDCSGQDVEAFECWNCNGCFDHEGEPVDPESVYAQRGVLMQEYSPPEGPR